MEYILAICLSVINICFTRASGAALCTIIVYKSIYALLLYAQALILPQANVHPVSCCMVEQSIYV